MFYLLFFSFSTMTGVILSALVWQKKKERFLISEFSIIALYVSLKLV